MNQMRKKFAIDDGSTNVKISWIENGSLKTVVSPNSFRKEWKSAALLRGQSVYNYTIGTTKYTYDATSDKALSTTHTVKLEYVWAKAAARHASMTPALFQVTKESKIGGIRHRH